MVDWRNGGVSAMVELMGCRIVELWSGGMVELVECANRRIVTCWSGGMVELSNLRMAVGWWS